MVTDNTGIVGFPARRFDFPVDIDGHGRQSLAGHFYAPQSESRNVLQVVVHGNSYDHRYWDAANINGNDYSYVRYMTTRGYSVLAVDLPGVGDSSRPPGRAISLRATAQAISALVMQMHSPNALPGHHYSHVTSIGHSMGSTIGVFAEAHWPAADSLVVTATGYYPGRASSGWAPGVREKLLVEDYAVVPTELREAFYQRGQADPDVIAYDNASLRTPSPSGLWSDCIAIRDDPGNGASEVSCPVYVQLGEHDPVMAGEYCEQEKGCYRSSPDVVVDQIEDIGHSFNLHLNHEDSWRRIAEYLDSRP